ncbi:MAG: ATP-binding protein [Tepidiformaceae bacterium]
MSDSLYIGKVFDPKDRSLHEPFLLDPGDLTTHGIIIGMTGSGKTGLSIGVIEELLKARVPVIVIDPKGDMGNLALAFDRLAPDQFLPWVDTDEAGREGKTPQQAAEAASATWTKGLADWGLSASDVAAYAQNHRLRIFTPGSSAGTALNLIDSMAAPEGDFEANEEELRDEIDSLVTALLGFVSIKADPVASREYILLFSLIENAWRNGHDLTLETLIGQVPNPPIEKVGALPMDAFYPQDDRNALMMTLNNLLASPRFEAWRGGEPADIERWVRSQDGRPQLTIVYTAHLDDDERTLVTALILNKLKTWMRRQPGTGELRVLFYMDEIFGYFPPTANPPTKKPLLSLLKQARAYGVGVLLATQNPVDLDYKGLSNMGLWAIGRLQTEQDQNRIREGIEAALADTPMAGTFEKLIAGVQKRVFLVHDIHRKAPALVHSRFAMSYLRGPITRDEIRRLIPAEERQVNPDSRDADPSEVGAHPRANPANTDERPIRQAPSGPPPLPAPLKAKFLNRHGGNIANPYLFVKAAVRLKVAGASTDEVVHELGFPFTAETTPGELLEAEPIQAEGLEPQLAPPDGDLSYAGLPAYIQSEGARAIERVLRDRLDDRFETQLFYDLKTKQISRPGEPAFEFAARMSSIPALQSKRATLQTRLAKKRSDLAAKHEEKSGRKLEKWMAVGTSILSNLTLLTGKRRTVTGVGGVLSKNRMEKTAEMKASQLQQEVAAIEAELAELAQVDPARFETRLVKPAKTDVSVIRYDIVWVY